MYVESQPYDMLIWNGTLDKKSTRYNQDNAEQPLSKYHHAEEQRLIYARNNRQLKHQASPL
eukprot:scaffold423486_cov18-Prasinocladus_malaysianus.AAC.1